MPATDALPAPPSSPTTPPTLRIWRLSRGPRWLATTGLMTTAVLLGVTGQGMLAGAEALAALMISALTLGSLIIFLSWAYQGDVVLRSTTLILPGGTALQRKRVQACTVDDDKIGGVLVLDLDSPHEQRRIPTGQPHDMVLAFASRLG